MGGENSPRFLQNVSVASSVAGKRRTDRMQGAARRALEVLPSQGSLTGGANQFFGPAGCQRRILFSDIEVTAIFRVDLAFYPIRRPRSFMNSV